MEICVITQDARLARFLILELAEAGFTAEVCEAPEEEARLCLCDLDAYAGALPENTIGFSYDESKHRRVQDFLHRPLHADHLIRTVAKRMQPAAERGDTLTVTADRSTRRIQSSGGTVRLSEKEFALLEELCKTDLLTRESAAHIFGSGDSNVVDVYMHYLRKKLKRICPYDAIESKRTKGYSLRSAITIKLS